MGDEGMGFENLNKMMYALTVSEMDNGNYKIDLYYGGEWISEEEQFQNEEDAISWGKNYIRNALLGHGREDEIEGWCDE
jgi:hypothetical protein